MNPHDWNVTSSNPIRNLIMAINLTQEDVLEEVIANFSESQSRLNEPRFILLIVCYAPLFIMAAAANTVVILVFFKFHYMRSITNYFLVNLSVADLLVTFICMPAAVSQSITTLWVYGDSICKITAYFQGVSVAASVFTITAMSIDRYLLIKNSMAFRRVLNRKSTVYIIAILWIVALIIFTPVLLVRRTQVLEAAGNPELETAFRKHGLVWCIEDWGDKKGAGSYNSKHIYGVLCFVIVYATPGSVVISAYSLMGRQLWVVTPPFDRHESSASMQQQRVVKERRRAARILLLLAVLFALCWLPYNVMSLILDLDVRWHQETIIDWIPFALLLGHANSAINPLLYCVMTKNLRKTVKKLFRQEFEDIHPGRRRCFKTRNANSSSEFDSYHQPHRRCYMLGTLHRNNTQQTRVNITTSTAGNGNNSNHCSPRYL